MKVLDGCTDCQHVSLTLQGASTRRLTCLFYLNPQWKDGDGGQLRLYRPPDGEPFSDWGQDRHLSHVDIEPLANRLLIFQSRVFEHEVLPSRSQRYSLTAWFY